MSRKARSSIIVGWVLLFMTLMACKYDDVVSIIRIKANGTGVQAVMMTNVQNDELSPAELRKEIKKHCRETREDAKRKGDRQILTCGAGSLPPLFSELIKMPPRRDTLDFVFSAALKNPYKILEDIAVDGGGTPKLLELIHNRQGFRIRALLSTNGLNYSNESVGSCSFFLQAPGPIQKTNADMVFKRYNVAGWNCARNKVGESLRVELTSQP